MSKDNEDNNLNQNEDMLVINADDVLVDFFFNEPQHIKHDWITVDDIINLEDGEILSDCQTWISLSQYSFFKLETSMVFTATYIPVSLCWYLATYP